MMTQTAADPEEIEEKIGGLEEDQTASWGDYPLDAMMIRNENRTVYDVLRRIDQEGRYVMAPDFQRDFIWPEQKQSKLIESVVMRIPLPVFYLAEDDEGRMIVVDGLQRLSTFHRFVKTSIGFNSPAGPSCTGKGSMTWRPSSRTASRTATSPCTSSTQRRPIRPGWTSSTA